jgi:imidazole glycerol-phosphate synthase subunit HisH
MLPQIVVIDYGMGNLNSIRRKLSRIQIDAVITSDRKAIENAVKIILPGVGHFQKAMENLINLQLIDVLNEAVKVKLKPILGICLGMQLFANHSEEGNVSGLSWIDAEVVRFSVNDCLKYKIPHIGWNQIIKVKDSPLMKGIPDKSEFYFVHSYHIKTASANDILNETVYEYAFTSAIENENIFGVQYHPEKSHDVGEIILRNFIEL